MTQGLMAVSEIEAQYAGHYMVTMIINPLAEIRTLMNTSSYHEALIHMLGFIPDLPFEISKHLEEEVEEIEYVNAKRKEIEASNLVHTTTKQKRYDQVVSSDVAWRVYRKIWRLLHETTMFEFTKSFLKATGDGRSGVDDHPGYSPKLSSQVE